MKQVSASRIGAALVALIPLATMASPDWPEGFEATVFHPGLGPARHIAVGDDGSVYVRLSTDHSRPGIVRLADEDGDHAAEVFERLVSDSGGTGIEISGDEIFYSTDTAVYALPRSGGEPRLVIGGFPEQKQHAAKSLALSGEGQGFVNVGAPSNACQKQMRTTPESPGQEPCPQLERQGGIWAFDPSGSDQSQKADAQRYVTGLRNAVALAWNPAAERLFLVQHGRDQLNTLWSEHYDAKDNAWLPAEEFHRLEQGANLGWPFTYYDGERDQRMLAPEYGGDGKTPAQGDYRQPLLALPAHWAPNDLLFYTGEQFPDSYRHGAFIAFHGSWNRAPMPQAGYNLAFVPMNEAGEVTGEWQVFAEDFPGVEPLDSPGEAQFRPTGLAVGPEGSLYISDSREGRIWKLRWTGLAGGEQ